MSNNNKDNIFIETILAAKGTKVEKVFNAWFKYQVKMPSTSLSFYFKSNKSGNGIIQTVCDDVIEGEVIQNILQWAAEENVLNNKGAIFNVSPIKNNKKVKSLDCILCIPASYHRYNSEFGAETQVNTTAFFPCNHIEFMADETKNTFNAVRDTISLTNWLRESQPRVSMRYNNPKMKSESKGKKLGVTRYSYALMHIENLWGAEGGFMELQNYKSDKATLKPKESVMEIQTLSEGSIFLKSTESLLAWSTRFLKS